MEANKFENVLEETELYPSINQHAKITYLHHEKERLEIEINELIQHNQLLRTINKELTQLPPQHPQTQLITHLNQQNHTLQQSYFRVMQENDRLASELLMAQQIHDQIIIEHQTIAKDYEEKIVELRRLIQVKQSSIQQLQKKLKPTDSIVTQPTNVTLLFFNQIDELKKDIEYLSSKSKQLQKQNKELKHKSDKLQKKLGLLQTLTTKSKLMYQQFKHYYQEGTHSRKHSAPKKDTFLPFNHHPDSKKHNNQDQSCVQTREFIDCSIRVDPSTKLLIYKQSLEILDLRDKYKNICNKLKGQQQLRQKVTASNQQLSNRVSSLVSEINYYKKSTQDFMQVLANKACKGKSCEKITRQNFINSIKKPAEISYITERKQFWLNLQQSIKPDRLKLLHIKNKYKHTKRSISCFVDYHHAQADHVEKYLNKKAPVTALKKQKMQEPTEQGSHDFSMFIDEFTGGDITIIQSSEKPKQKTNYSQWKRNKNMLNLTILEQNIL